MDKLTIEYLAPYLAYKVAVTHENWDTTDILEVGNIEFYLNTENKLILHPLSDLTKEIEHKSKKLIPIDELKKIHCCIKYNGGNNLSDLELEFEPSDYEDGINLSEANKILKWLYEHHFAVNIPEHLYIDINTI